MKPFFDGRPMGLEPTTFGTTIRHSNLLSYDRHLILDCKNTFFFYKKCIRCFLF